MPDTASPWLTTAARRIREARAALPQTFTASDARRNDELDVWIGRLCAGALIAFVALSLAGVLR
ncbi:hypothetical protein [Derxia gummosa]|uniref:Uncharacterized protein n=1 Tax=Derxia gummosa DSM 723 TaxID=1121388 RepID=A0A8B6X7M8_9BURK|nr:hypothetical protein [Derxia gummosa]